MCLVVYAIYLALAFSTTGRSVQWIDNTFPDTFFYHLHPDEASGPIGDPLKILVVIWIHYLEFAVFMLPTALFIGAPISITILLALANEPIIMTLIIYFR